MQQPLTHTQGDSTAAKRISVISLSFKPEDVFAAHSQVIDFIEKLTQLHKDDVISAGGDLDEWMQVS